MSFFFCETREKSEIVECEGYPKMLYEGGEWTSCSAPQSTREELIAKCGILKKPCACCGRLVSTRYVDRVRAELTQKNVCFYCNFWQEWVDKRNDKKVARIGGQHYVVEAEPSPGCPDICRGFGGSKFTIHWHDGRKATTRNLWTQGVIPKRFREQLPDNAKFVHDETRA